MATQVPAQVPRRVRNLTYDGNKWPDTMPPAWHEADLDLEKFEEWHSIHVRSKRSGRVLPVIPFSEGHKQKIAATRELKSREDYTDYDQVDGHESYGCCTCTIIFLAWEDSVDYIKSDGNGGTIKKSDNPEVCWTICNHWRGKTCPVAMTRFISQSQETYCPIMIEGCPPPLSFMLEQNSNARHGDLPPRIDKVLPGKSPYSDPEKAKKVDKTHFYDWDQRDYFLKKEGELDEFGNVCFLPWQHKPAGGPKKPHPFFTGGFYHDEDLSSCEVALDYNNFYSQQKNKTKQQVINESAAANAAANAAAVAAAQQANDNNPFNQTIN